MIVQGVSDRSMRVHTLECLSTHTHAFQCAYGSCMVYMGAWLSRQRFCVPPPPMSYINKCLGSFFFGCCTRITRLAIYNEQKCIKLVVLRTGKPLRRHR